MYYVRIIDGNGYFVEDAFVNALTERTVAVPCPAGFYRPKWDGVQWIEGGTAPEPSAEAEISELKAQLAATDYRIIKYYEYQLAGEPLPYDIAALHAERQALRDQISALEIK